MKRENFTKVAILVIMVFSTYSTTLAQHLSTSHKPARVQAVKAPIARELPNGDTLMVYLRGDERIHWSMTLDGWQIEEHKGWFYYVTERRGAIVRSCRKAHNEDKRSKCEQKWLTRKGINRRKQVITNI